MGCCLISLVLIGAPRVAFLFWWLFQPLRIQETFSSFWVPLLGILFLPWTTLVYVMVFPGGIVWFDWIFLALALALDISAYTGGVYSRRNR